MYKYTSYVFVDQGTLSTTSVYIAGLIEVISKNYKGKIN